MSKVAFVFPGQGTQYVGMGEKLYESVNNETKELIDNIYNSIDNKDLKNIMANGTEDDMKDTRNAQPSIAMVSTILAKLLMDKGIKADYVAGHSLGEYSSLYSAGVLTIEDTISLISTRGKLMSEAKISGGMAAILGLSSDEVESICNEIDGVIEPVNYNEPKQTVVAGDLKVIENSLPIFKEKGAKRALLLAVSGPFHSSLMKPVAELIKAEFSKYEWKTSIVPIIANTTTNILQNTEEIQNELYNQTFGPVKWVETIQKLKELGVETIYEIGPGKVLSGLIKKIDSDINLVSIENVNNINEI